MTRKIPWRDGVNSKSSSRSIPVRSSPTRSSAKRLKADMRDSDAESKYSASPLVSKSKGKRPSLNLSRSDSHPPEPLEESFMMDGLDEDDVYRMVEDEFYLTATKFTAHLHAAEYKRLQEEAKSHNAATIRNISRPVVGRMTELVKKKQEHASRLKRHKAALAAGGNDSDDDSITNATSLFGLMESPRKKAPHLGHFVYGPPGAKSASNAIMARQNPLRFPSLGSSPTHHQVSGASKEGAVQNVGMLESDDDNLDSLFQRSSPIPFRRQAAMEPFKPATRLDPNKIPQLNETINQSRPSTTRPQASSSSSSAIKHGESAMQPSDDDSDEALFGFQKRAKSRAQHRKSIPKASNTNQSTSDRDFIPGFL